MAAILADINHLRSQNVSVRLLPSSIRFHDRFILRLMIRLTAVLLATATLTAFAQQAPEQLAGAELPSLLTIYKDLHTHPELSTFEERSSAIVAKELKATGCEVTDHVGKYEEGKQAFGVVGVMKNGDGPVVLVRTDMDALPVHEETGAPYASTTTMK